MNPYVIKGPTSVSFSGGRTSAFMLRQVLDANAARDDLRVVFANTGKEHESTLEFVEECGQQWGVAITWLEWRDDAAGFEVVDFASASRAGEPFEALIRKRGYLPNPITRFCTSELKVRPIGRWLKTLGWDEWDSFIGIRADEPRRVAKIRERGRSTESASETMCMPLADAGVGVWDVASFWDRQTFGLRLGTYRGRTLAGNCDLCFLKPLGQRLSLVQAEPDRVIWWARMESEGIGQGRGARFRKDEPGYAALAQFASDQGDWVDDLGEGIDCLCGE